MGGKGGRPGRAGWPGRQLGRDRLEGKDGTRQGARRVGNKLTLQSFPGYERFELGGQLRRAAYSVPANTVEGMAKIGARFQNETAALASSTRGPKARALETLVRPRDQFRLSRTSGSYSVSIPTVPSGFTGRGPDCVSPSKRYARAPDAGLNAKTAEILRFLPPREERSRPFSRHVVPRLSASMHGLPLAAAGSSWQIDQRCPSSRGSSQKTMVRPSRETSNRAHGKP
jgi:hypothetical protein